MSFPSYHPDEWDALVSAVESDMGTLLPDRCLGQELEFQDPDDESATKIGMSCCCKKRSMLVTVYDPSQVTEFDTKPMKKVEYESMVERGGGYARVCGVCDAVAHWPKYNYVLEAG